AAEHERRYALCAQVLLERRAEKRAPARLEDRDLALGELLHATAEQRVVVEPQRLVGEQLAPELAAVRARGPPPRPRGAARGRRAAASRRGAARARAGCRQRPGAGLARPPRAALA